MKFYYSLDYKEENKEDREEYEIYDGDHPEYVAAKIVEMEENEGDYWESDNATVYLWNEKQEYVGKVYVEIQLERSYHGYYKGNE